MATTQSRKFDVSAATKGLASSMRAAQAGENIISITLTKLCESPTQPRRRMDQRALKELAESIKASGQSQPIVVREIDNKKTPYEIVFGHRRWRACGLAGKSEVQAVVRNYSDAELLTVQLTENIQKESMDVFDIAARTGQLVAMLGLTEAAVSIGKPKPWCSKMNKIATGGPYTAALAQSGWMTDIESLYMFARIEERDAKDGSRDAQILSERFETDAGRIDARKAIQAMLTPTPVVDPKRTPIASGTQEASASTFAAGGEANNETTELPQTQKGAVPVVSHVKPKGVTEEPPIIVLKCLSARVTKGRIELLTDRGAIVFDESLLDVLVK